MKKNIDISPNIETLFGTRDENLRLLEDGLNVTIVLRPDSIEIEGEAGDVGRAQQVFTDYEHLLRNGFAFVNGDLGAMLRVLTSDSTATLRGLAEAGKQRSFGKRRCSPRASTSGATSRPSRRTTWCSALALQAPAKPTLLWPWDLGADVEARQSHHSGASGG